MTFQFTSNGSPIGTVLFPSGGALPLVSPGLWGVIDRIGAPGVPVMPFVDPQAFKALLTGMAGVPIVTPRGAVFVRRYG